MSDVRRLTAITEEDVLRIRHELFADRVLGPEEVDRLFALDEAAETRHESWIDLFVDELTYYFVWQTPPWGYVDEDEGALLQARVTRDGRIAGPSELALLVSIIETAGWSPPDLALFVLRAVRDSILRPEGAAYANDRAAGVVTGLDVELIRAVLHGAGGLGSYSVTRDEAEILFEISRGSDDALNDESWRQVFCSGVATHLIWPDAVPVLPSPDELKDRERWMEERLRRGSFIRDVARALMSLDVRQAAREVDLFGRRARRAAEAARLREEAAARERAGVDAEEAAWLTAQAGTSGVSGDARALLDFLEEHAAYLDPSLDALRTAAKTA